MLRSRGMRPRERFLVHGLTAACCGAVVRKRVPLRRVPVAVAAVAKSLRHLCSGMLLLFLHLLRHLCSGMLLLFLHLLRQLFLHLLRQ